MTAQIVKGYRVHVDVVLNWRKRAAKFFCTGPL
jgi:hypothetical protein